MDDKQAIEAVVEAYHQGSFTNDAELLASAFHPEATVSGVIGSEQICIPVADFVAAATGEPVSAKEKGCDFRIDIDSIDVDDPVAHVKFHEYDNNGTDYITHFLCTKRDGKWAIIAKLFLVV